MKHIFNAIQESLMDDEDEIFAAAGSNLVRDWFDKYATGSYKIRILKSGNIKITGDVLIKGFPESKIPANVHIEDVNGSMKIEKCPNLTDIEDLFAEYTDVKGDFSISNCPKLTSLKGGPYAVKGNMYIVGNSSLRSLEGMPQFVYDDVYVMKNGKKFNEKVIASYVTVPRRIVCSEEDESVMINEAMNEPHLLKLAQQLKDNTLNGLKYKFSDIFGPHKTWLGKSRKGESMWVDVAFDEIDSSHVTVYRDSNDTAAQKAIRRIVSKDTWGIILFTDYDGEYMFAITSNKKYRILSDKYAPGNYKAKDEWIDISYTDIMYRAGRSWGVVIIEWKWDDIGAKALDDKRHERRKAREGMITNTPEQNARIAKENAERYKKLVTQIKAQKNVEFEQIDKAVSQIVQDVLVLSLDAKRDPEKYDSYDVTNLLSYLYGEREWVGHTRSYPNGYVGTDGILKLYSQYTDYYMSMVKRGSDHAMYLRQLKEKIFTLVDRVKARLDRIKKGY